MALPTPRDENEGEKYCVQLPALSFLKTALYSICRERGISRAELSRRLGWHREQVDRLFRLDHNSRLGQLEEAFKAIDVSLTIKVDGPEMKAA